MPWVRLDEDFYQHPKVLKAGPLGMAMQVAALCYSNKYLTNGFIPRAVVPTLLNLEGLGMRMWEGELVGGGQNASWELVVEDLLAAGLWEEVDGGYQIHDYLDYQPSREQVIAEREAAKERMRRSRKDGKMIQNMFGRSSGELQENSTETSDDIQPNFTDPDPGSDPDPDLAKQDKSYEKDRASKKEGLGESIRANSVSPSPAEESPEVPHDEPDEDKRKKQQKRKYAEFVSLTEQEYVSLIERLGSEERVKRAIEILDNYKGAKGKRYKSDYRAILNWVIGRLEEEEARARARARDSPAKIPRAFQSLMELVASGGRDEP